MKTTNRYILLFTAITYCLLTTAQSVDEYTLKAIWIGKFTHFIDWPEPSTNSNEFFTIACFQPTPFGAKLEEIYKNYNIWDKQVKLKYSNLTSLDSNIHILYIPTLKSDNEVLDIIEKAKQKNILLISDTEGYAELGVHINFYMENKRIRFEINETSMRNSNFIISYRLLSIAKIVEPIVNE